MKALSPLRRGFSLVELSIVILIIGILMIILFGVITGVIDIISLITPNVRTKSQAFLALNNVASCIRQTYFNPNNERLWFLGSQGDNGSVLTLACVHPGAEELGRPSVREVSYYLKHTDRDRSGTFTLFRREDELVDRKPGQGGLHYPLLHNVKEFRLRYTLNGKKWLPIWKSRDNRRIPRIVEIKIIIEMIKGRGDQKKTKLFTLQTLARPGAYIR